MIPLLPNALSVADCMVVVVALSTRLPRPPDLSAWIDDSFGGQVSWGCRGSDHRKSRRGGEET